MNISLYYKQNIIPFRVNRAEHIGYTWCAASRCKPLKHENGAERDTLRLLYEEEFLV